MTSIFPRHDAVGPMAEPPAESLSELFHENTKLRPQGSDAATIPIEFGPMERSAMVRAYKLYRRHPRVLLPTRESLPPGTMMFDDVISRRRTARRFGDAAIELDEIAKILHQSYGITEERPSQGGVRAFRAAPSAGALYPGEIYLGIRRVTGLAAGVYHYEVPDHSLALLFADDPTDRLYDACCRQDEVRHAAAIVLVSGVIPRTKRKYGERGYRYVLLDVGHLMQNLVLASTALGLAVMTTVGFYDDEANALLRIDGVDETVLYVAFLGRRPTTASPGVAAIADSVGSRECSP